MVNYLEILRLHHLGCSQRSMESATGSSRHTIREFIGRANDYHISWPLPEDVTNGVIEELLYAERKQKAASWREPDYAQIHSELARSGVMLTLLWSEYCARCHQENRTPYMYTQFCEKYRSWARVTKATMRITRKPGQVMEVDWAGTTIPYFDSVTGVASAAYLFVAALPCSGFTYAEACLDMKSENWQLCHSHAYSVPFNLIGEQVQIRLTRDMVEVYLKGGRVASHQRKGTWQRDPIVNPNHMPDQHREYLKYNSDDFTLWSREIGTNTEKVVTYFLTAGTVPEQGYKFCASLTKLAERYGGRKLECGNNGPQARCE